MAASPSIVPSPTSNARRRSLVLTPRRIEANRRNAAHSTGPRTAAGKAKVARNGIKHGFFAAQQRWTPTQRRNFQETLDGLRADFNPAGPLEEACIATIAESYVRMAAMLRYENLAALKYHQHRERELNQRIAAASPAEAERLTARREELRRAGLWRPTIPGERDVRAIVRYSGSLDRAIRRATSELQALRNGRIVEASLLTKVQKQTHLSASPRGGPEAAEGPRMPPSAGSKVQKQTHLSASPRSGPEAAEGPRMSLPDTSHPISDETENAKANPLSSMFTGNRHQRRRAKALAARRR